LPNPHNPDLAATTKPRPLSQPLAKPANFEKSLEASCRLVT